MQPLQVAVRGARDMEEAQALVGWLRTQINDVCERRLALAPRYLSRAGLKVMEILKNMPLTNCRACSYLTCMAYAAALREGETTPESCPTLGEEPHRPKAERVLTYLKSYGWRALDDER